uniref:undecaprenyldiphospho-muramoylpentapeptide beta-N-acetylglucosaminyltransferase n=1 Tax=Corynebacterium poyangense TaxID=2684405 RepID=UPI001CC907F9|nr:undecaprenyldiphospho-muramoylpentapeptide beta-N-acetylglucosaminyltransferase [Corynebacterium poyangense]
MGKTKPSIVVAGGGTAGHIEPALAVADALREKYDATVTALGTHRGLEVTLVPERGYDLRLIDPVPVPRKLSPRMLSLPAKVGRAVRQTRAIVRDVNADALIGFGGYVAAPAYLAARSEKLPFFVHEANARAGLANKLGVRLGGVGLNAVPGSGMPGDVVGIPIRSNLGGRRDGGDAQRGREKWGLAEQRQTLLITGGSQGAKRINDAVAGAVETLVDKGIQVLHAYGPRNDAPKEKLDGYVAVPYIDDMPAAYAVADLIVCRAGAMTVAEVTAANLPAVYIPLPHGNGEQGLNARDAVRAGAARVVRDADFDSAELERQVVGILNDASVYNAMASAAGRVGAGDVAAQIADRIISAVDSST